MVDFAEKGEEVFDFQVALGVAGELEDAFGLSLLDHVDCDSQPQLLLLGILWMLRSVFLRERKVVFVQGEFHSEIVEIHKRVRFNLRVDDVVVFEELQCEV